MSTTPEAPPIEDTLNNGFALHESLTQTIRDRRQQERSQRGTSTALPPELRDREEALVLDEAAQQIAEEAIDLDEAMLINMWRMFQNYRYRHLEFDTFEEWAMARYSQRYEDPRNLKKWVFIIERVLARIYEREWTDPIIDQETGEVIRAETLIRTKGLFYRLRTLSVLFDAAGPYSLSPFEEEEAINLALHESSREVVDDYRREKQGKQIVKFQMWAEPTGKDEEGEQLVRPMFVPVTWREYERLKRRLGPVVEELSFAPRG